MNTGPLIDPGAHKVPLLLGHLGDVAQRHDRCGDGLGLDARGQLLDLFWRDSDRSSPVFALPDLRSPTFRTKPRSMSIS
nr:hypothetical protein [Pseudomonas cichorii]